MSLAIQPVAPFDLSLSLSFLAGFGPMRGEQSATGTTLTKVVSCRGQPIGFRVRQAGDRERPRLDVDLVAEGPLDQGRWREVLGRVRAFLSVDEDLALFYAQAGEDAAVAPLVAQYRGLHHVRFPSPFEAACWGLINQRTAQSAARRMKAALARRAGGRLEVDGVEHLAFPEPQAVASLGLDELERLLPGGRRGAAVYAAARAFATVDDAFLREGPIDDVRAWLRAIHGVGPFTSSFVLYRGLGRFDGVSVVADKLVQAAQALYGRPMTQRDVARIAESYGTWGGYWMLYVWGSTFLGTGVDAGDEPGCGGLQDDVTELPTGRTVPDRSPRLAGWTAASPVHRPS